MGSVVKLTQDEGRDWCDLKFPKDPDEYENKTVMNNFPIARKIPIMDLKAPGFVDRFSHRVADDEMDHIGEIPLEVIRSAESGKYLIVKGLRYYFEGINQGIHSVQCAVVGKVKYDYEAYISRIAYVFTDHQPFHILEQTKCVHDLKKMVINQYGNGNVFPIGGDRRSVGYKKISLIKIIKERLQHRKSTLDILKRFGDNIGSTAIIGLHRILSADNESLSLHRIHRLNPIMRRMRLRQEIDGIISRLTQKKVPHDQIEEAVAYRVYDVLYKKVNKDRLKKTNQEFPKDDDGDESEGINDSETNEAIPNSKDTVENSPETTVTYPIGPKVTKIIKNNYIKYTMKEREVFEFLMSKKELSKNETTELQRKLEIRDLANTDFMCDFLKAASGIEINE